MSEKNEEKKGFFAKLLGSGKSEEPGKQEPTAEEKLVAAEARIAAFDEVEAQVQTKFEAVEKERDEFKAKVEGAEKAQKDAEGKVAAAEKDRDAAVKAKTDAEAKAKQLEDEMPAKVASGVADRLATLGVKEDELPGKDEDGKDINGLKGRERVAAAFKEQAAGSSN